MISDLEFREGTATASVKLSWYSRSLNAAKEVIPRARLFSLAQLVGAGLLGHYFDNADFTGSNAFRLDRRLSSLTKGGNYQAWRVAPVTADEDIDEDIPTPLALRQIRVSRFPKKISSK